jgi:hypothetical protein
MPTCIQICTAEGGQAWQRSRPGRRARRAPAAPACTCARLERRDVLAGDGALVLGAGGRERGLAAAQVPLQDRQRARRVQVLLEQREAAVPARGQGMGIGLGSPARRPCPGSRWAARSGRTWAQPARRCRAARSRAPRGRAQRSRLVGCGCPGLGCTVRRYLFRHAARLACTAHIDTAYTHTPCCACHNFTQSGMKISLA